MSGPFFHGRNPFLKWSNVCAIDDDCRHILGGFLLTLGGYDFNGFIWFVYEISRWWHCVWRINKKKTSRPFKMYFGRNLWPMNTLESSWKTQMWLLELKSFSPFYVWCSIRNSMNERIFKCKTSVLFIYNGHSKY